jgi:superoxide reductase
MKEISFYRCEKCGNIVVPVKVGGGTLACCGQSMTKLVANSTDAAKEKHVPVVTVEGDEIKVTVGSVEHPMTAEHYIEWIALVAGEKVEILHLEPGMKPKAEFTYYKNNDEIIFTGKEDEVVPNCEGQPCNFVYHENAAEKVTVYAYCNLHGLWKAEL